MSAVQASLVEATVAAFCAILKCCMIMQIYVILGTGNSKIVQQCGKHLNTVIVIDVTLQIS
jgi:hypothetical protein